MPKYIKAISFDAPHLVGSDSSLPLVVPRFPIPTTTHTTPPMARPARERTSAILDQGYNRLQKENIAISQKDREDIKKTEKLATMYQVATSGTQGNMGKLIDQSTLSKIQMDIALKKLKFLNNYGQPLLDRKIFEDNKQKYLSVAYP